MAERIEANADGLTGVWNGLYSYPDGRSVAFVATLIQHGRALSGATNERCQRAPGGTLFATLAGSREGGAVAFRKTYDGTVPGYGMVDYAGSLNAEATEIEGRWTIAGMWSGKFLMIRPHRKAESTAREASVRA
jgi:hypothetical protein